MGIRACVRASCSERIISSSASPDNSYDAQLIEGVCATGPYGSTYHVLAIRKTGSSDRGTEFFTTETSSPDFFWSDARRLIVTINTVSWIGRSRHQADGLEVSYRLADNLSEQNFERELQAWQERVLAEHRPVAAGRKDPGLEQIRFTVATRQKLFEQFKAWARINVLGSYPR